VYDAVPLSTDKNYVFTEYHRKDNKLKRDNSLRTKWKIKGYGRVHIQHFTLDNFHGIYF